MAPAMRIAIVHSFYSSSVPSGENRVVEDQAKVLLAAGHDVLIFGRRTDDEAGSPLYPIRSAARVATGFGGDPTQALMEFAPDVVHVHNLFPNFGTRWLEHWQGPLVVSLHNYRAVCSNGLLYRGDSLCLDCPTKGDFSAVRYACYRGSRLATLPIAVSRRSGRRILQRADAVITTSEASHEQLGRLLGLENSLVLIPNFGPDDGTAPRAPSQRSGWVAMGRFSPEKGFVELLKAWPSDSRLTLIGDGELARQVTEESKKKPVLVEHSLPREELRQRLQSFTGLVFPSRWLEVAPQVVVEAMRVGLPVVAYEANGIAGFVSESGTGVSYGRDRPLQEALRIVEMNCDAMSKRASEYYFRNWRPIVWKERIMALYEKLILNGSRR